MRTSMARAAMRCTYPFFRADFRRISGASAGMGGHDGARGYFRMSNSLIQLSDELAGIVERTEKSVVAIYGGGRVPSSGVHWKEGLIVTAEHALRRDEDIKIGLHDGRVVAAELAGRDPGSDLAVLKF